MYSYYHIHIGKYIYICTYTVRSNVHTSILYSTSSPWNITRVSPCRQSKKWSLGKFWVPNLDFLFICLSSAGKCQCLDSGKGQATKILVFSIFFYAFSYLVLWYLSICICCSIVHSIVFYPLIWYLKKWYKCSEGFLSLDSLFSW